LAGASPRYVSVLLTPLQELVAQVIERLPEASGFAMAGAGALTVHGLIDRPTQDLDYFTAPGDDTAIVLMRDAVEEALNRAGLTTTRRRDLPTFVRLEVSDGADTCQIDLAIDYRALPTESSRLGPTLATKELGAGKVLAIFDRAEARDFRDLDRLLQHFTLEELMDLAADKDPGFDRAVFRDGLARFRRFTPEDLGVSETEYERLRLAIESWRRQVGRNLDPPERGQGLGQ
jgi:hypothetical protein